MSIEVRVEPSTGASPGVSYRWDAETDMLTASLSAAGARVSETGAVELEGRDGSWLSLGVDRGRLVGVAVAVWPEVRARPLLAPPVALVTGDLLLGACSGAEVETSLSAESDDAEEVIYFRVGTSRATRTVRVGRELLVDLDRQQRLAGIWLLNVPPFPSSPTAP
jgi:hypothetical protein